MFTNIKVIQNGDTPIYKQITAQLEERILNGEIAEGEFLPSLRQLAKILEISAITTIKAYKGRTDYRNSRKRIYC